MTEGKTDAISSQMSTEEDEDRAKSKAIEKKQQARKDRVTNADKQ